jgi:mono/diheme cytochrome c family protein
MTEPTRDPRTDVEALHRVAARGPGERELPEPTDGLEPTPWWLWVVSVVAIFVSGFYLGRHGGAFSAVPHTGFARGAARPGERPELARPQTGAELYASRCAACHRLDARGLQGQFPPLVGSEWVTGDPEITARIVLLGLQGPLEVAGGQYNGTMPSWTSLTDAEIAAILTHVRGLSGASPVDAALVSRVRTATRGEPSPLPTSSLPSPTRGAR